MMYRNVKVIWNYGACSWNFSLFSKIRNFSGVCVYGSQNPGGGGGGGGGTSVIEAGQGMILPIMNIGTGYQIGLMWSSPLTQGIKIGLLGYGGLLRLSQGHIPIGFHDRPAIQAEARTFFFFFACQLSTPNQTGYIRGVQYCNRVCIWMFLVRYIVTGCIFRAPSALWQGQVLTPPPQRHPPIQLRSRVPPPPPPPREPE